MGSSQIRVPRVLFFKGAVLYWGTPKRDPSLENCPHGCKLLAASPLRDK